MKKYARTLLCLLTIISLIVTCNPFNALADGTVDISAEVTFGQTEARSMLKYINEFRTSTLGADADGGAWYWNEDNTTKTVFNTNGGTKLNELVYDYELEQAAQQRAVEAAVKFDHIRPNGEECFSIFPSALTYMGENLAAGNTDAHSTYIQLREDSDKYVGQGHRRNMLNPNYNVIGIGHVVMDGYHYWVHVLGYRESPATVPTAARNDKAVVPVEIQSGALTLSKVYPETASYTISVGQTNACPRVVAQYSVTGHWPYNKAVKSYQSASWTSGNSSVVSVGNDGFTGKGAGSTKLTGTLSGALSGKKVEVSVAVSSPSISKAIILLEYDEAEYTGKNLTPKVKSVKLNGITLVEGTDYTVSYSNNRAVGYASVTVSGKGSYSGSVSTQFRIKACSHVFDNGKVTSSATCTATGKKLFECTKCDYSKSEVIPAKGHTLGAAATCTSPQICTTCKVTLVPIKGHTPGSAATCTSPQICTTCKVTLVPIKGHTPGAAATCTSPQICTTCKATLVPIKGHTPGSAATCTSPQICTTCKATLVPIKGHTPGAAATCTSPQICTTCKATLVPIKGHTPGSAATCTSPQICTTCKATLVPATGKHVNEDINNKCDVCGKELFTRLPGDVNADGKVTMLDSTVLRRWLAEWDVTIIETNADVNADGRVDMRDSVLLRRYLAGWSGVKLK